MQDRLPRGPKKDAARPSWRSALANLAEHHVRRVASVFSAFCGMMAAGSLGHFPAAEAFAPTDYGFFALLVALTILSGFLTVQLNKRSVRWTVIEMIGFFGLGLLAPLLVHFFG